MAIDCSFVLATSSKNMLSKYGDETDPCLTPKFTSKHVDHLTQASHDDSQFSRTIRSSIGMCFLSASDKDYDD